LSRLLEKLEAIECGRPRGLPFAFFAVFQREGSDAWDLVVSAPWLDADEMASWEKMSKLVTRSLTEDELVQLGRIVILNADNRFLKDVMQLLPKGVSLPLEMHNFTFSGVKIQRGRILAAPQASPSRHLKAV